MKVVILQYRGLSIVSKMIQTVTWSRYSHSAIGNTSTGWVGETWEKGGSSIEASPWANHTPNTPIDIYTLQTDTNDQHNKIWQAALHLATIDAPYDYLSLLGFLPILRHFWQDKLNAYFCSHAVAHCCRIANCLLFSQYTPLYKVSPGLLPWSPRLSFKATVKNNDEWDTFLEQYQ